MCSCPAPRSPLITVPESGHADALQGGEPQPQPPPGGQRPLEVLEREICELAAHIAAATCRWLLLVAEFDQRGGWAEWGVNSCAHWLSWRCSIATRSAREHVRVARGLAALPLVREAFASGELSYSKVRALTRVASPETEPGLVELARHATGGQLDKLVRLYRGVLVATVGQSEKTYESRAVMYYWDDDGSLRLDARLPAEEGALVLEALKLAEVRFSDAKGESSGDEEVDLGLSPSARRADALVAVARATLTQDAHDRVGGDPVELVVHVDAGTLADDRVHDRSELEGGPALPAETVRRLGCDAAIVRILERDGQPLSVGRRTRSIPVPLRRALRSRDRGCCFPGCDHTRFLHAHHIQHWARGGRTELANLVQLCSHHHRLVHEGGFQVERRGKRGLVFRRPDGKLVPNVPPQLRARGASLEERSGSLGLVVHDRTCMPRSAGDRLDYGIAVECLMARVLAAT